MRGPLMTGQDPASPAAGRRAVFWPGPAATAVAVLMLAGLLLPNPVCLLVGLVLAAAVCCRRWLPWDAALPVGTLGVLLVAVAAGLAAAFARVDLLRAPHLVAGAWVVLAAVLVACAPARSRLRAPATARRPWTMLAHLPAGLAAGVAVLQQLDVRRVASWMFRGTDFAEHAVMLERLQSAGFLSYATETYPRGVHALLALVSGPGVPAAGSAALLSYDLRLLAAATWLALALLLWTMSGLVLHAGAALGLSERWRVAVALGMGIVVLHHGSSMLVFVAMAAAPGLLAAVAACTVPLVAMTVPPRGRPGLLLAVVTALAVAALAQTWPPLLPVPLLAFVAAHAAARSSARAGHVTQAPSRPGLHSPGVLPVVVLAVAATATVIPLVALMRGGGRAVAAIPGSLPGPSLLVVGVGTVCAVLLLRGQRTAAASTGAVVGAFVTVAALLVAAGGGFDVAQYYPRKALWFLAVLVLPAAAVLLAAAARWLCLVASRQCSRLGRSARVGRIGCAAVAAAAFVGYVLPVFAVAGTLAQTAAQGPRPADARKLDIVLEHPSKYGPARAVPVALGLRHMPTRNDTYVLSKLFGLRTGQPQTSGRAAQPCAAVREVAGDGPAVVVTDLDAGPLRERMRRQGCGDIPVLTIPGGDEQARKLVHEELKALR